MSGDFCEDLACQCGGGWTLPLQRRAERKHLYQWVEAEEVYVAAKFDDQLAHQDQWMNADEFDNWIRQVVQYYDRAKLFLSQVDVTDSTEDSRVLQMKAQQAMAKAMMTAKGMVESSIRVFGPLPTPGVTSGQIEVWDVEH